MLFAPSGSGSVPSPELKPSKQDFMKLTLSSYLCLLQFGRHWQPVSDLGLRNLVQSLGLDTISVARVIA